MAKSSQPPPIERNVAPLFAQACEHYPVVVVTGPRQSGKTTFCRTVLADRPYANLEPLDRQTFARSDPRGFLAGYPDGAILDEVQNVPELFGYIQELVDEDPSPGRWILTGSQHFGLSDSVSQSLAGRASIIQLLPPSRDEVLRFSSSPHGLAETLWSGAYPRIWDRGVPPDDWLRNYLTTYVQRDVRQVLDVGDLQTFTTFLRLAAGRSGQEINYSSLGADVGVSHHTIRSWLSVLETSFIVFRVPAFRTNVRKRLVKSAKLYFVDSGLMCHLLQIRSPEELLGHPLRGAVFETWVASEILKARVHRGLEPHLYHYREASGVEVDLIVDRAQELIAVEAKSGATVGSGWLKPLTKFATEMEETGYSVVPRLVYGGEERQRRTAGEILGWDDIQEIDW